VNVLALETATTVCGAAVLAPGGEPVEEVLHEPRVHAERIMTLVDRALERAGLRARNLDGVAVSIGPGSFTGLRIGLSVAKGLCWSLGIPLAAVPTLRALAAGVNGRAPAILAALAARRGEVYCQMFRSGPELPEPSEEPRTMRLDECAAALAAGGIIVTGEAAAAIAALASPGGLLVASDTEARCSPAAVARLGARMLAAGGAADLSRLEPLYLMEFRTTARPVH